MSRQDIYGTIKDDILGECGHTSSRRGKVKWINFKCKNDLGIPSMEVFVETSGCLPRQDEQEALDKIKKFSLEKNSKKAHEWGKKLVERKMFNIEQDRKEWINVAVDLPLAEHKQKLEINGVIITPDIINIVKYLETKDWKGLIEHISHKFNEHKDIISEVIANEV